MSREMLAQDKRRTVVDVDLIVPVGVGHFPEGCAATHASVVDQDVEAILSRERLLRQSVRLLDARQVGHDSGAFITSLAKLAYHRFDRRRLLAADEDAGALAG